MSNYVITPYSYNKAKELNLTLKASKYPVKKIDVYKDNIFLPVLVVASIWIILEHMSL